MPKLSEFFGVSIYMYWRDHGPAHFHARYAGERASIAIEELGVIAGSLSPRVLGLVMEWASLHQDELREAWHRAVNNQPIGDIYPL